MLPLSAALRSFVPRALLLALCVLSSLLVGPTPAGAEAGTGDTEAVIARRLAEARAAAGVASVVRSGDLDAVARDWARRQAADGEMKHNPDLRDQVQPARGWYENVGSLSGVPSALSYGDAGHRLHEMWMESDGHRANILRSPLTDVGIGVASSGDRIFATVVFRLRGDGDSGGTTAADPEPSPTPEPEPTPTPKPTPAPAPGPSVGASSTRQPPASDPASPAPAPAPTDASAPAPDPEPETGTDDEPGTPAVQPGDRAAEVHRRTGADAPIGELAALAAPADAPAGDRYDDRPPVELRVTSEATGDLAVGDDGPRTVPLTFGLTTVVGAVVVGATRGSRGGRRSR